MNGLLLEMVLLWIAGRSQRKGPSLRYFMKFLHGRWCKVQGRIYIPDHSGAGLSSVLTFWVSVPWYLGTLDVLPCVVEWL